MPLQEPYVSPMVHKNTIYKPDPATLPTAGRVDVKAPSDPSAFHRRKAPEESLTHLKSGSGQKFTANSLSRESFVPHTIERRQPKFAPDAKVDGSKLAGLGKSMSHAGTNDWASTRNSTIDQGAKTNAFSQKREHKLASDRELTQWKSEARSRYGDGCKDACNSVLVERSQRHQQQASKAAASRNGGLLAPSV